MDSVTSEDGLTIPKQTKIVDKTKVMNFASGFQPGVKTEDSAKTPRSTGQHQEGAADKNRLPTSF